ncbi:MAG: lysophospholipid acyltransferase family protein [Nitrospiraceae bacterium]|nr:lysophospholipid acyltransferase family protein [Nitrospiraceae bacterium]
MSLADRDTYSTDTSLGRSLLLKIFGNPSLAFYPEFYWIVRRSGRRALQGRYGDREWSDSSREVMTALERAGVRFELEGMDNLKKVPGPLVFVGNHMGTLETMVLPCIIQPVHRVTFIVKESLTRTPVFGPVMRSRDPIVVGRKNPREDLKAVLEKGAGKLAAGTSIIVFPQSTRSPRFNPEDFNTLGIKLASRAGVPLLPVALKTDAWGIGSLIKDFGRIDTTKTVHIRFGEPMAVTGRGMHEHEKVIAFIRTNLEAWSGRE